MKRIWPALLTSRLCLLVLVLLAPLAASATHIVGGELELRYKSGNVYTLSLNLYFDGINGDPGALDPRLTASIFAKANSQRMANVVLENTNNTFVSYTNPACAVGSLSTRKLVYTADIVLAGNTYNSPQGYYVAVERCCRNVTISNIVAPGAAAQAFTSSFRPWCATAPRSSTPPRASSRRWATTPAGTSCFTTTLAGRTPTATRWPTTW
ncbi:hypothetical protein ACFQT0_09035 [Hymenobacter humi]|uniref:Gliding motility-associated C-terminal domain-containing protein n=1 Tax=Hymenobacter humi TaxID=1411620 RepID=A0ABW2U512_9BACT